MGWSDWLDGGSFVISNEHKNTSQVQGLSNQTSDFSHHIHPYIGVDVEPLIPPPMDIGGIAADMLVKWRTGVDGSSPYEGTWHESSYMGLGYYAHYYRRGYSTGTLAGFDFYWMTTIYFVAQQVVFTCGVTPMTWAFPTDPDPSNGYYYEHPAGVQGWDDWNISVDATDLSASMSPQSIDVTYLPGDALGPRGDWSPYTGSGSLPGFFSNRNWPLPSDGTLLCTLEKPTPLAVTPYTIPLSGITDPSFTLLFTPRPLNGGELPIGPDVNAPLCYPDAPGGEIFNYGQSYVNPSLNLWSTNPAWRFHSPRYKQLEPGIPPLRQRARNDGLTTDTRQEKRQLSASPLLVPDLWWVGRPGEEGGSGST